jgi:hypothetical protein
MPCASFEDLLLDYSELSEPERECVNLHISGCAECREYLEIMAQLDARLLELYAGVNLSQVFQKAVLSRVDGEAPRSRLSMLPEVLDFIGWAGVIIVVVCLALPARHLWPGFNTVVALCTAVALLAAVWAGVRSYADLNSGV